MCVADRGASADRSQDYTVIHSISFLTSYLLGQEPATACPVICLTGIREVRLYNCAASLKSNFVCHWVKVSKWACAHFKVSVSVEKAASRSHTF